MRGKPHHVHPERSEAKSRGARVRVTRSAWPRVHHALVLAALLLTLATPAHAREPKIVLDPGHGGSQQGALGPNGLMEKALCLTIARKVGAALEKVLGAKVVYTRQQDVLLSLPDRVELANRLHPDLFISLHANSMPTRKLQAESEGIETYFLSADASNDVARRVADRENLEAGHAAQKRSAGDPLALILADLKRTDAHADSSRLAYAVHQRVIAATGAIDRGVQQAPFYVLNGVEAPSILLEVGFVSNPKESAKLRDGRYQERIANAIAEGVKRYLAQVAKKDERPATASAGPR